MDEKTRLINRQEELSARLEGLKFAEKWIKIFGPLNEDNVQKEIKTTMELMDDNLAKLEEIIYG
ncbi:hypothetical protein vipetofem_77 [Enterococcus phage vipetofem]|jgi:hypothetical protein|uniref:Uncharacterized protein n=3 Tax=Vipetofemvirus TaxID=2948949 RepID=A0A6G9LL69_9CAUD|nr:hypothetical protein KNU91_gp057 [Enterococcus phage nattely]YP_010106569.1 hypothetical protein KNU92_gp063 [Enterococcus phage vipetofem]CAD0281757.1 hypothetical protein [Enterococcus phage vB_EfaS_140]SCO93437.1 hypothetical protein [Enterococcus phage VPE25]SCZ84005.1 hypothetical protein [Enterococcus phage VFW]QIQ66224.1 hypothetical protein nattely_57 [Enterococcus phage nattely]QIQ66375.1 hypothetical protein vipetofem_77 [Enterococcus phage vipetofem]